MGVIVVGVDGSDGAKEALRFALAEAKLRQATVSAVHVWQVGFYGASGTGEFDPAFAAGLSDVRAAAEAELEATVNAVVPSESEVEVTRRVVEGTAGAVLVEQSRDAELLVVASRGQGASPGCCWARSARRAPSTQPVRS